MDDDKTEVLSLGGFRCRFNLGTTPDDWRVVGPVHLDSRIVPFFEMENESWATREEAITAVREEALRLLVDRIR
ncbi:MAG TPA: hypothetical protein VJM11_13035 [Nevskiaceae bacterium]|nr:hypothetical protein [Nevskiaceae bacterium]